MGVAVQAAPPGFAATLQHRVLALAPLLPYTADNPLLGQTATYRVAWAPCTRYPTRIKLRNEQGRFFGIIRV